MPMTPNCTAMGTAITYLPSCLQTKCPNRLGPLKASIDEFHSSLLVDHRLIAAIRGTHEYTAPSSIDALEGQ